MQNVLPSILDQLLLSESQTAPQPKRYDLSAKICQQIKLILVLRKFIYLIIYKFCFDIETILLNLEYGGKTN